MPTALTFISAGNEGTPRIFSSKDNLEEKPIQVRRLFRNDFIGVMQPAILDKLFPVDKPLTGFDIEYAEDHVLLRPFGFHSVTVNGHPLADGNCYAVNIHVKDLLSFGEDDFTLSAFLVN